MRAFRPEDKVRLCNNEGDDVGRVVSVDRRTTLVLVEFYDSDGKALRPIPCRREVLVRV